MYLSELEYDEEVIENVDLQESIVSLKTAHLLKLSLNFVHLQSVNLRTVTSP